MFNLQDDIVVILDIDEIFIRRLTQHRLPQSELSFSGEQPDEAFCSPISPRAT